MSDGHSILTAKSPQARGLFDRMMLAHPRQVGESYAEHAAIASRFGVRMILGGIKCVAHAVLPAVFERAASDCVGALHAELTARRSAASEIYPDYII